MNLHTVENGDTLFGIARKYAVSPMKIIENNGLVHPDRLVTGEELLILTPTKTYTVRGGDTLSRIATRYEIKKNELYANNPALGGEESLYAGQLLALRYDAPRGGMAAVNGYVYPGCPEERLRTVLPYLTYVTFSALRVAGGELIPLADHSALRSRAKAAGRSVLLRAVGIGEDKELYESAARREALIEALAAFAKEKGYDGITVSAYRMAKEAPKIYDSFLMEAKKRLLGCDLLLFSETDANVPFAGQDLSDGVILQYDKCSMHTPPSFREGEEATLLSYADKYESTKAFVDLSCMAYDKDEEITREEMLKIAYKYKAEIKTDPSTLLSHFTYRRFGGGGREDREVRFEPLSATYKKLLLLSELGYNGVSVDVARAPIAQLMLLRATFAPIDYAFAYMPSIRQEAKA